MLSDAVNGRLYNAMSERKRTKRQTNNDIQSATQKTKEEHEHH